MLFTSFLILSLFLFSKILQFILQSYKILKNIAHCRKSFWNLKFLMFESRLIRNSWLIANQSICMNIKDNYLANFEERVLKPERLLDIYKSEY